MLCRTRTRLFAHRGRGDLSERGRQIQEPQNARNTSHVRLKYEHSHRHPRHRFVPRRSSSRSSSRHCAELGIYFRNTDKEHGGPQCELEVDNVLESLDFTQSRTSRSTTGLSVFEDKRIVCEESLTSGISITYSLPSVRDNSSSVNTRLPASCPGTPSVASPDGLLVCVSSGLLLGLHTFLWRFQS